MMDDWSITGEKFFDSNVIFKLIVLATLEKVLVLDFEESHNLVESADFFALAFKLHFYLKFYWDISHLEASSISATDQLSESSWTFSWTTIVRWFSG